MRVVVIDPLVVLIPPRRGQLPIKAQGVRDVGELVDVLADSTG